MDTKYKKIRPADLYLSIVGDNKPSEVDLWTGNVPNQWGNRASGNDFIDLFAGLIRRYGLISAKFYAKKLGVEYRSLLGAIQAMCGMGAIDFIHEYLNLMACELIEKTELSITEVSKKIGCTSPVTFCRFFKHMNKCQPMEYRNLKLYGKKISWHIY